MNIKILIATHKEFKPPKSEIYLPVQVGAKLNNTNTDYQRDDEGDNISELNPYFCELTALYWAWKNLEVDYLGLVHYRRYLSLKKQKYKQTNELSEVILGNKDIEKIIDNNILYVPKKRKYYIETLYSHYSNTFNNEHLDITREIILEINPNYITSYDKILNNNSGYMFNMVLGNKKIIDSYCEWLFPILFRLKERIDVSNLSLFDARLFGRVSEILFNVWLDKNNIMVREFELYDHYKINWWKKGSAFLMAKFFKKKYRESF